MPGWTTTGIEYKRHETLVHAVLTTEVTHCLDEGCRSKNIKANGPTREQYIAHIPLDGRPSRIAYRRQCYYCKDCKKTSLQPVKGLYKGTNMTRRLRRYIVREAVLMEESFSGIAQRVGRSERNIRDIFQKHLDHLNKIREIETPCVMGMDGVYVNGQESLIVTDLERRRPVMMRPFIKERAIAEALREMPDLGKIKEVVADAAGGLDRAQKAVLPKAIRTKDRYHVQRLANTAVDEVRRAVTPGRKGQKKGQKGMCPSHILRKRNFQLKDHERAALQWCLGLYPELLLTYELKETYCEFWDSPDGEVARLKYAEWLELHKAWKKQMPEDLRGAFAPLIRLMKNWEEGIFNYFHGRHTNAYTESANARVKELARKAPNARFELISAKIVLGTRAKQQRKAVRERGKEERRAQHTQQSMPTPTIADAGPVSKSLQANETLTPLSASGSIAADAKKQGTRLDMDRIAAITRKPGGEGTYGTLSSPQLSLFE
ncbi:MAG: ISL3 family transposase [Acidobacteria bacterium]|nr:ISL3 family transposase [Acidobacteriota bacterium]